MHSGLRGEEMLKEYKLRSISFAILFPVLTIITDSHAPQFVA